MSLKIIGTGLGRTGTYSLKSALEKLGFGPCHHMEYVVQNMPTQVPLWNKALTNDLDFENIYTDMLSAVDWPTAGFYHELYAANPNAKFILTHRNPESWAESFGSTIYTLLAGRKDAPAEMQDWLNMAVNILDKTGFSMDLDHAGLAKKFEEHNQAVQDLIPAKQLLVYQVKQGWQPLCEFLDVQPPQQDFPRTNNREEFWNLISAANQS